MSVVEVTSKSFQNGISAHKWASLCRLLKEANAIEQSTFETELSNSILMLFANHPADMTLLLYMRTALREGLLSLPNFLATFLEAAKTPLLHDIPTLDSICKLICEEQLATGLPPAASLTQADEPMTVTLQKVQDSLMILSLTTSLVPSPFHDLVTSASELVALLLTCITDMSQLSTVQALNYYTEVQNVLHTIRLGDDIVRMLDNYSLSLNLIFRDNAKYAQEAQMMQTIQLSQGKGDILGPNSQTDLVSCSLILRHLVTNRTSHFGSGNTAMAVAILVSAFRWTSWSPKVFYTQLFQAAVTILAQVHSQPSTSFLWRSFIITRLTTLLPLFERVLNSESMPDNDWRGAMAAAMTALSHRPDLFSQCDEAISQKGTDEMAIDGSNNNRGHRQPPFFRTLLQYCVHKTGLINKNAATQIDPSVESAFNTQLGSDSHDSGQPLDAYIDAKLSSESNSEEQLLAFLQRAVGDTPNHPLLSTVIQKRLVNLCQQHDVEGLGTLCNALNLHESALDVISLHVKVTEILAHVLAFVDEFDCESVGDPQTAVGHLGNVVLFLQSTIVRYQLTSTPITLGGHTLKIDYLMTTSSVFRTHELSVEERTALPLWTKALFDQNSEGIEDSILRATKPKTLLKIAASLVMITSNAATDRKMDMTVLNNGISYFTGPLLNWTLVGVIKALLREIFEKDFESPVHLEVLQTLLQAPQCPLPVLRLTGHGILALLAEPKLQDIEKNKSNSSFNVKALKTLASKALGVTEDDTSEVGAAIALSLVAQGSWLDQPRKYIRDAISTARESKAPSFDVARCVTVVGPTKFLSILWDEVSTAAHSGHIELGRRLATYALLCPSSGRVPPLLPVFFGSMMHTLLARIDNDKPAVQSVNIELLVATISSSLTGVLQFEWALRSGETQTEGRTPVGQSSVTLARRLATDLKRSKSSTAEIVMQRLSSSPSFVANFPMMVS